MTYKVEKNIPLTPTAERRAQCSYPFKKMAVGDSFIISETYTRDTMQLKANAARNWARTAGNGWRFSCRKTEDNKVRIWRVK